ncbi:MAG TPA: hypothetical protein VES20_21655 [Bryobacteraceae bacterium]|nr:hypothetical protein [Bryobacteraceae bacterium]
MSGAAIFMVMNALWGRPSASGRYYAVHLCRWAGGLAAGPAGPHVGPIAWRATSDVT